MANGTFLDEEDEQNTELNGTAAETLDTARNAAKTAKEEVTENPVPAPEQPEAPVTESTEPPAAPAPAEETPAPETPAEPEPVQTVDNRWVSPDREDRQKRQQSRLELARRLEKMSEFISKETGDDPDFKETHDEAVKVNELLKYSPQRFADLSDEDAAFVANDIQTKYDHANQRRGHLAVAWDAFKKGYWSTGNMIYQGGTMLKPGGLTQDDADNIRGSMQTNEDMEILNPQKIGGVENIHSIGDAIDWLTEVVGENATRGVVATAAAAAGAYAAPVLATALGGGAAAAGVAGTIGSILTGTLGTMAMNTGEAVQDQMNDPRNNDDIRNSRQWALAQGFGYSVLDGAFGVSAWGAKLWTNMLRKVGVKELAQTGAVAAARQIEKNTVLGNVLKDIALHGVLGEGVQEVAQSQVVGRGVRWAQYGSPFKMKEDGSTETLGEAGMEALNEFAGGAAAGLTFGLLGGAGAHVDANKRFKTLDGIEDVLNNDPKYQKLDIYGKILVKQHLINDSFLETSGYLGYKIEDGKLVNEINERTQMNKEIDEEIDRMGDEKNANETEKLIGQSARAYLDIFKSQYSLADIDTVVGSPEGQKYQSNVDVAGMKASAQPYTDKEGNRAILMECPNTHITIAQLCDKDGKPTGRYVVNNDPERKSPVFGTKTETVKEVQKDENGKDVEVDVEKRTSEFDCASAEEALEKARKLDVYNQWRADRLKMKMDVARKVFDNIFAGRGVNLVFVDKPSRNAHINGISTGAYTAETNTVELAIDSIDNLGSLYTTLIHERSHEDIVEFLLKSGKFYKKVGDRTTIDWDAFNLAREQLFAKVKGAEEMSAMFRNQGAKADENGRYKDSEIRNEWGKSAGTAGEEMVAESASVGELANRLRRGESGVFGSIIDAVRSAIGMRMAMDMRVDMSAVKKEDVAKEIDKIFKIGYIGVPAPEGFERKNATERTINPTDEDYVLSTDQFKAKFGSPDVPSVNPGEKLNLGVNRDSEENAKKTDSAKKVDAVPVAEGNLKPQMNSGDGAKMANGTDIRRADGTMFTKTDAGNGNYVWVGMSGEVVDDETASRGGYEVVGSAKSAPAPKAKKSATPKTEKAAKPTEVKAEPTAATESVAEATKTPVPAVAEPQTANETAEATKAAEPVKAAPVTNAAPKEVKTEKAETKPAEPAKSETKESAAEPATVKTEEESPVKVEPGEKIKIPQNRTEQPVKVDAESETATVAQEKPKKGGKAKKADKPKSMPAKTKRDLLKQTGLSAKAIGPKAEAAWMNLDEIPNGTVVSVEGAKFTKVGKIAEGKPESKWTNAEGKTVLQTKLAQIVAQYGDFKTESAPVTETKPTEAKDEEPTIPVEPEEKNEKKQVKKEDSKAEPKKSEPTPKPDNAETKPVEPVKVDKEKETVAIDTAAKESDDTIDRIIDGDDSLKFVTPEQRKAAKEIFRDHPEIDDIGEAEIKKGLLVLKVGDVAKAILKPDGSRVTKDEATAWMLEAAGGEGAAVTSTRAHVRFGSIQSIGPMIHKSFPKEYARIRDLSDDRLLELMGEGNGLAAYELFFERFVNNADKRADGGLVKWLADRGVTDPQEVKKWALNVYHGVLDNWRKDRISLATEKDLKWTTSRIDSLNETLKKLEREEAEAKRRAVLEELQRINPDIKFVKSESEKKNVHDESTKLAIMDQIVRLTGQGVPVTLGYGFKTSVRPSSYEEQEKMWRMASDNRRRKQFLAGLKSSSEDIANIWRDPIVGKYMRDFRYFAPFGPSLGLPKNTDYTVEERSAVDSLYLNIFRRKEHLRKLEVSEKEIAIDPVITAWQKKAEDIRNGAIIRGYIMEPAAGYAGSAYSTAESKSSEKSVENSRKGNAASLIYSTLERLFYRRKNIIENRKNAYKFSEERKEEVLAAIKESRRELADMKKSREEAEAEDVLTAFASGSIAKAKELHDRRQFASMMTIPREYRGPRDGETLSEFHRRICSQCVDHDGMLANAGARAAVKREACDIVYESGRIGELDRKSDSDVYSDALAYVYEVIDKGWANGDPLWTGRATGNLNLESFVKTVLNNYVKNKSKKLGSTVSYERRIENGGSKNEATYDNVPEDDVADSNPDGRETPGNIYDLLDNITWEDVFGRQSDESDDNLDKGYFANVHAAVQGIIEWGVTLYGNKFSTNAVVLRSLLSAWGKMVSDAEENYDRAMNTPGSKNVEFYRKERNHAYRLNFSGKRFGDESDPDVVNGNAEVIVLAAKYAGMAPLAYQSRLNQLIDGIEEGMLMVTPGGERMLTKLKGQRAFGLTDENRLSKSERRRLRDLRAGKFSVEQVRKGLSDLKLAGAMHFGHNADAISDMEYNGDEYMAYLVGLAEEGLNSDQINRLIKDGSGEGLDNPNGKKDLATVLKDAYEKYGWIDTRIKGREVEVDEKTGKEKTVDKDKSLTRTSLRRIIDQVLETYDNSPLSLYGSRSDRFNLTPEAVDSVLSEYDIEVGDDTLNRIAYRTVPCVRQWLEDNGVRFQNYEIMDALWDRLIYRLNRTEEVKGNKEKSAYERKKEDFRIVYAMMPENGGNEEKVRESLRKILTDEYDGSAISETEKKKIDKRVDSMIGHYKAILKKDAERKTSRESREAKAAAREQKKAEAAERAAAWSALNEAAAKTEEGRIEDAPYSVKRDYVRTMLTEKAKDSKGNDTDKFAYSDDEIREYAANVLKMVPLEVNRMIKNARPQVMTMEDVKRRSRATHVVADNGISDSQIESANRKIKIDELNSKDKKSPYGITDTEMADAERIKEEIAKLEKAGLATGEEEIRKSLWKIDRGEKWNSLVKQSVSLGETRAAAVELADSLSRKGLSDAAIDRMLAAYRKVSAEEEFKAEVAKKAEAEKAARNKREAEEAERKRQESQAAAKAIAAKRKAEEITLSNGEKAPGFRIPDAMREDINRSGTTRFHFRHSAEDKAAISGMKASQKAHGFLDAKYKGRPHRRDEEIDREAEELRQKIGTREWQAIVERGRTREALTEAEIRALTLEMGSRMSDTLDKNLTADESEDNEKVLDELSAALVGSLSAAGAALRQAQRGFNIRTRDTDVYIRAQLRSALEKEAAKKYGEAGVSEHAAEIEKAIEEKSAIIAEQAKELQKLHDQIDTLNSRRIEAKNDKASEDALRNMDEALQEAYRKGYSKANEETAERRDKALSAFSKKFGDRLDSSKSDIGLAALSKLASIHNISRRYAGNPSPELDNDTRNAFKALLAWTKKDENVAREALREDGQESLIPLFDMFIKETDRESKPADGLKETGKRNRDRILDDYVSPTAATVEESDAEAAEEILSMTPEELKIAAEYEVDQETEGKSRKSGEDTRDEDVIGKSRISSRIFRKMLNCVGEAEVAGYYGDDEAKMMYIGEYARNRFKFYYLRHSGDSLEKKCENLRQNLEDVFKMQFSYEDVRNALLCRGDFPAITKKRSKLTLEQLEQAKALVREGKPREAAKMANMDYKSDDEIIEELDRRLGNVLNQRLNVFESRINEEEDEGLKNEIHELIAAIREVRSGKPMEYLLGKYLELAEGMKDYRRQKSLLDRIQSRIDMYARKIAENDFEPAPKRENPDCDEEIMIIQSKNRKLEKMRQMYKNVRKEWTLAKRPWLSRAAHGLIELLMESKAVAGAMDLSSVLRQGGQMTWAHPLIAAKNLKRTFAAFKDEKAAEAMFDEIWSRPNAKYYLKAGIDFTDWGEGGKNQSDQFMLNHYRKFTNMKLVKAGVTASERAFSMYLNMMRADMFDMLVRSSPLRDASKFTEEQLKAIGNFINIASQRGVVDRSKELGKALNAMNMVLWSPRNILSRFQFLWNTAKLLLPGVNPYGASSGDMMMRKMFAKETLRYITGVAGAIFFTKMMADLFRGDDEPPEDVVLDPRSSDFLKVKVGNTRLDFLSGLQQMFVFGTRAFSHQTVNLRGELKELSNPADYYALFARFARSKFSPMASIVWDTAIARETYDRQDVSWSLKDQLRDDKEMVGVSRYVVSNLFCPLSFRDLVEQAEYSGIGRAPATWILTMLGAGVQAFDPYTYKQMSQDFKYFKNLYANADSAEERSRLVEYHPMLNRAGAIEAQIKYVNRIKRDIKNAEKAGMRTDLLEDMLEREQKRAINLMAGFKKPMDVD